MLRLITRHGQIATKTTSSEHHLYPSGDPPLSELGREQARLLGKRLAGRAFLA